MKEKIMKNMLVNDVSIEVIIHNDLYYYVLEGYGGKSVENWPFYGFFYEYYYGDKEKAFKNFCSWYIEQFSKYFDKPKKLGGMYRGSLYTLIEKRYKEHGLVFNHENIEKVVKQEIFLESIAERVKQRFEMFDNILQYGYNPDIGSNIYAVKKNKYVCLKGGHHRCAALKVLGYNNLPGVLVYPNTHIYLLNKKVRRIFK